MDKLIAAIVGKRKREFKALKQIDAVKQLSDFHDLYNSLQREVELDFDFWYEELQKIWATYLSREEKEHFDSFSLEFTNVEISFFPPQFRSPLLKQAMERSFSSWFLKKTNLPLHRNLSFHAITIPNPARKYEEGLEKNRCFFTPIYK